LDGIDITEDLCDIAFFPGDVFLYLFRESLVFLQTLEIGDNATHESTSIEACLGIETGFGILCIHTELFYSIFEFIFVLLQGSSIAIEFTPIGPWDIDRYSDLTDPYDREFAEEGIDGFDTCDVSLDLFDSCTYRDH
jgi:hypothetical protein